MNGEYDKYKYDDADPYKYVELFELTKIDPLDLLETINESCPSSRRRIKLSYDNNYKCESFAKDKRIAALLKSDTEWGDRLMQEIDNKVDSVAKAIQRDYEEKNGELSASQERIDYVIGRKISYGDYPTSESMPIGHNIRYWSHGSLYLDGKRVEGNYGEEDLLKVLDENYLTEKVEAALPTEEVNVAESTRGEIMRRLMKGGGK